jgi:hypothetical protein
MVMFITTKTAAHTDNSNNANNSPIGKIPERDFLSQTPRNVRTSDTA